MKTANLSKIAFLFSITFIFFLFPNAVNSYNPWKAKVTSNLNLRSGPGNNNKVVFVINNGSFVDVVGEKHGWYNVYTFKGNRKLSGWVYKKYIKSVQTNYEDIFLKKPNVGYKKFLVINFKRIGFGGGGAMLDGKFRPNGTVFEIIRENNNNITVDLDGKPITYAKKSFNGAYGSAGSIATYKWDYSNNLPTALDLENQVFRKYYHFFVLNIYRYFWQFASIIVVFSLLAYFFIQKPEAKRFLIITFILFLLFGGCQGNEYQEYLNNFSKVAKLEGGNLGGFAIGSANIKNLNISPSTAYSFGNIIFVPIFLTFHMALFYFFYNSFPFLFYYIHYLFVPHPVEKYLKDVKKGKRSQYEAFRLISDTMYNIEKDGIPVKWRSDNWRKRIDSLTKRVKSEDEFIKQVIDLIKTKNKF